MLSTYYNTKQLLRYKLWEANKCSISVVDNYPGELLKIVWDDYLGKLYLENKVMLLHLMSKQIENVTNQNQSIAVNQVLIV